jgi:hypothetical protein
VGDGPAGVEEAVGEGNSSGGGIGVEGCSSLAGGTTVTRALIGTALGARVGEGVSFKTPKVAIISSPIKVTPMNPDIKPIMRGSLSLFCMESPQILPVNELPSF